MPNPNQITYDKLRERIALLKGWRRDFENWNDTQADDAHAIIQSGLQRVYNCGHKWSFMRPVGSITADAPYATGTVTVAAAANGSTVTLAGGTWPAWAADAVIQIEEGGCYLVVSRTSDSVIVLEGEDITADAGSTFSLARYRYDLETDFGGLDGPLTYDSDNHRHTATVTNEAEIRQRLLDRWRNHYGSDPFLAAVYVRAHDLTTPQTWKLELYPPPQERMILRYRYRSQPNEIDDDNPYPLGGATHSDLLLRAVLAEAELSLNAATREYESRYQEALAASIKLDRNQGSPDFLPGMRNPFNDEYQAHAIGHDTYPYMCPGPVIPEGYEEFF